MGSDTTATRSVGLHNAEVTRKPKTCLVHGWASKSWTYFAELIGRRAAAAVDGVAFEVEQRLHSGSGIAVRARLPVNPETVDKGQGGGRTRGPLEDRAGQAEEVGGTDQEGLQGDVGRHLEMRRSEREGKKASSVV